MTRSEKSVIIVGAGITGLTAAHAALQAGASVTVFERSATLAPLGTAISLWPNALACLSDLDLADIPQTHGMPFNRIAVRCPDGDQLMAFDLSELHSRHNQQSCCITRASLQADLLRRLPDGTVVLGAEVTQLAENASSASVKLADGRTKAADLVIVADGQNSTLRPQVAGTTPLRAAGYGAVLGLADIWTKGPGWSDTAEACEYYGPNGRFGMFQSGTAQTYWFFVSDQIPAKTSAVTANRDWMMDQLRDWPAFTRTLVEATPDTALPQVSFFDRKPARHWGKGRCVLAGDAAHPMIPNFGQGACQGIEDAHALGQLLANGLSGAALAKAYTRQRKTRAEAFVSQSRMNGKVTQPRSAFGRRLRNFWIRNVPQSLLEKQLNWQFTRPEIAR